jgi:acetyltransferase
MTSTPFETAEPPFQQGNPETLEPFFNAQGVAIIGASANPNKLSHGLLRNLINYGFQGAIYPVNPHREVILDLDCYPDIASVPDPIDLAVIALPAALCPAVLEDCGRRGVEAVIVISGGFKEVGPHGQALEERLVEISQGYDMRLLGPNCVGTLDAYSRLNTTFIRTMPQPGEIAFISQSGAICGGILEWASGKHVGFSRFATLGNEADVTESDLIEALAQDPHTKVIVAYIEAIEDGRRFMEVARHVTPHKPIVAIKAGTTEAGTRAVSSHTGSLAGTLAAYDAAFRQTGVIRVHTLQELFNVGLGLAYGPLPKGNRVAIVTNAGGPASLAADKLEQTGLQMPSPSSTTRAFLAGFASPEAQLDNPIDLLGGAEPADFEMAVRALLADPKIDAVLPILVPQALIDPLTVAQAIGRAAADRGEKPVVTCFMGDDGVREPLVRLHRHRITLFQFPDQAAQVLGHMWRYAAWRVSELTRERMSESVSERMGELVSGRVDERHDDGAQAVTKALLNTPDVLPVNREKVAELLQRATDAGKVHLGELEARPILAAYGVLQPPAQMAHSADEARRAACAIGFPVVLKIVSPNILHKSDVGGIALDLDNEAVVAETFTTMMARVRESRPEAPIHGVLVASMASKGHELIIGMRRDPQFGPLLLFGLGGIYVEILNEVAFRVAPFDRAEALRFIDESHAGKLLKGIRGQPPADVDAVVDTIERVAQLALDFPQIQELDINPLIAYPAGQGALAVDARIVLG